MSKFIKSGKDGTVLKGRDVEFELQGRDVDPVVKSLLIRIADVNQFNVKSIAELALLVDRLVDGYQDVVKIAGNMKDITQQMMKGPDVDDDISTTSN